MPGEDREGYVTFVEMASALAAAGQRGYLAECRVFIFWQMPEGIAPQPKAIIEHLKLRGHPDAEVISLTLLPGHDN